MTLLYDRITISNRKPQKCQPAIRQCFSVLQIDCITVWHDGSHMHTHKKGELGVVFLASTLLEAKITHLKNIIIVDYYYCRRSSKYINLLEFYCICKQKKKSISIF